MSRRPVVVVASLAEVNPELAKEWHPTLNGMPPSEVGARTSTKVWWLGVKCGHVWDASVKNRANGAGCGVCAGKRVLAGFNDLQSRAPEIALEWHPTLNDRQPAEVHFGSEQVVWWLGAECGHTWDATPKLRTRRSNGCPICAGKRILVGFNDLASVDPSLAAQWHPTMNDGLTPKDVLRRGNRKAWWQGKDCGHSFLAAPAQREVATGCNICLGRSVLAGFNDLQSRRPDLARDWHPTRNGGLLPSQVPVNRRSKAWWLGAACGHEWESSPSSRSNQIGRCPVCLNRRLVDGVNDLASTFPELAVEWHPTRNGALTPGSVTRGYSGSVWWRAACGHEWKASPQRRTVSGSGCPQCRLYATSKVEEALCCVLRSRFPHAGPVTLDDVRWGSRRRKAKCDIYIPSLRAVVEYDGDFWHERKVEVDREKSEAILACGYVLVRVREDDLAMLSITSARFHQLRRRWAAPIEPLADQIIQCLCGPQGGSSVSGTYGRASSSVSKTTTALVTSETATSKAVKAAQLGIPVIDPAEFAAMLAAGA